MLHEKQASWFSVLPKNWGILMNSSDEGNISLLCMFYLHSAELLINNESCSFQLFGFKCHFKLLRLQKSCSIAPRL